jgi:hypothetical protein
MQIPQDSDCCETLGSSGGGRIGILALLSIRLCTNIRLAVSFNNSEIGLINMPGLSVNESSVKSALSSTSLYLPVIGILCGGFVHDPIFTKLYQKAIALFVLSRGSTGLTLPLPPISRKKITPFVSSGVSRSSY